MGLCVRAYAGIKEVIDPHVDEDEGGDALINPPSEHYFKAKKFDFWPHAAPDLNAGHFYQAADSGVFVQVTCTFHSNWRSVLSQMVEESGDNSFAELINFSDCEGVLGPATCVKLAQDFAKWDSLAQNFVREMDWEYSFYGVYKKFRRAFEYAGIHGAVVFS